jgi:hypothetical protein
MEKPPVAHTAEISRWLDRWSTSYESFPPKVARVLFRRLSFLQLQGGGQPLIA